MTSKKENNKTVRKEKKEEDIVFENEEQINFVRKSDSKLKKEIKKLKKEKKEYLEGWQRARADLANLKKQHETEKKIFTTLGREAFLLDILPIIDNFEAAFSNKEAWEKVDKNWRIGVEYIYKQFIQKLEDNGVEKIGKIGEKFDEKIHSATENIVTNDKNKDHTVAEIVQSGYKLGEKIVREAKVKVFEFKK